METDKNIEYETKKKQKNKQKKLEQKLGCKFIRIGHDKEVFDIFKAIIEKF